MPKFPYPITHKGYQDAMRRWAQDLGSDGCSKVPDFRLPACYEHDCHWQVRRTLFGDPITIQQANNRFWDSTRRLSPLPRGLKFLDPMAAWRWIAVSLNGLRH
jgi:hypothetical protein